MQYLNRFLLSFFSITSLLIACNTGSNPTQKSGQPKTATTWDTAKIKVAVNNYLRTHEKHYNLIDSLWYVIGPLNKSYIAYDQASYYTTITTILDRQNSTVYVIPPGSTAKPPEQPHNEYQDSANFYYQQARLPQDSSLPGFRVFINYRLSDVMLTYSDFTPYLFYFDTAYHQLHKSDFLHYTNIKVDPPNQSGVYFDTPYPYVPSK